jgi:3-oxoacyl-[acyl-carrier protein] reductase
MTLTGKAARGGGRHRARDFDRADEGAAVACCDIDMAGATQTARLVEEAGGRALAMNCDVAIESDTRKAVVSTHNAFGQLDILVSGAAPHEVGGTVLETSLADWERVWPLT